MNDLNLFMWKENKLPQFLQIFHMDNADEVNPGFHRFLKFSIHYCADFFQTHILSRNRQNLFRS